MYRLLIVDDEAIITDGLYEILTRVEQFELDIYKCYSSQEALELINRTRFDILLTDIQMPGMNGLQLAQYLRAKWPKCRIVFLTGHHDFDYVYDAIQHERVSYILKTEGYDKVIDTIKFAIEDTEQQFHSEDMLHYVQEQQAKRLHALRQQLLINVIKERIHHEELTPAVFAELNIALQANEPVLLLLGKVKQMPRPLNYAERSRQFHRLEWIAGTYFDEFAINSLLVINEPILIWLIQPQPAALLDTANKQEQLCTELKELLHGHLDQLQQTFQREAEADVSFVIDHSFIEWRQLAERYEQLSLLFQYRIGAHDTQLIMSTDMVNAEQQQLMHKNQVKALKLEQLQAALHNGQADAFFKLLGEIMEQFEQAGADHIAEEIYLSVALIFFSYINRWNLLEQISEKVRFQRLLNAQAHESRTEAAAYLQELGEHLLAMQHQAEEERAVLVIAKLQQYVFEHLHDSDKLSLIYLAETFYFNASYLSRLFKQVTSINLSDFIVAARIERAKQLLAKPDMKIQEVGERVGYASATNFTRFFKRLTGMTPQDYRITILS
ncbi:hypothetical protein J40TS1_50000 [Paenibacillus montaniterrae]|uniref:DNA-binding response regulator n=1 Tax=Paenibacillus montaniterrae TaxID=429341 RepID=A0A920D196_9BACL|nr:response regulator [Paenibacillus montaniterrae]GIP19358.1 hypothetical protein J40TS1_50000 [Paenibacillus montaniterrae]